MQLLLDAGLPFTLFIEPHNYPEYQRLYGSQPGVTLHTLAKDHMGLWFVRQVILSEMRALHQQNPASCLWYWMLDDDIASFYVTENKKTKKLPVVEALAGAQRLFDSQDNVAQAGLEYQQFAWSATKEVTYNSYCDVAVAINLANTRLCSFRDLGGFKSDRDFTLQVLSQGYRTAKVQKFSFSAPKNGSNKGGLQVDYLADGREAASSARMCELWPGICSPITKPDGRPDVKINWRAMQS